MALLRPGGGQLAARLLVAAFVLWPRTADGAAQRGFVARAGSGFVLDGAPFHVVGANQCVLRAARARPRAAEPAQLERARIRVTACCSRARAALRPLAAAPHGTGMLLTSAGPCRGFQLRCACWATHRLLRSHMGGE
jgi:hypothetical protein